jgi:hypothetical protein
MHKSIQVKKQPRATDISLWPGDLWLPFFLAARFWDTNGTPKLASETQTGYSDSQYPEILRYRVG